MNNKKISIKEEKEILERIHDKIDKIIFDELKGIDEMNCLNVVSNCVVTFFVQSVLCCKARSKEDYYNIAQSFFCAIKETLDINLEEKKETIN